MQKLVPSLQTLNSLLDILLASSNIDKSYLVDVVTKLYIATDSNPVDVKTSLFAIYIYIYIYCGLLFAIVGAYVRVVFGPGRCGGGRLLHIRSQRVGPHCALRQPEHFSHPSKLWAGAVLPSGGTLPRTDMHPQRGKLRQEIAA